MPLRVYSTLPLILVISGAVLGSSAGGFLLVGSSGTEPTRAAFTAAEPAAEPPGPDVADPTNAASLVDVQLDMRKARFAADAEMLALPEKQSAVHYYARVLQARPDHELAGAELDAALARLSIQMREHLASGAFTDASNLAAAVSAQVPDHALSIAMRASLDEYATGVVRQAVNRFARGDDVSAVAVLAALDRVRGLPEQYVAAANQSIVDLQRARINADLERARRARLSAERVELDWEQSVIDAIAAGRLIAPEGDSALDLLSQPGAPAARRTRLTAVLSDALLDMAEERQLVGDFAAMQRYLETTRELGRSDERVIVLEEALWAGLADEESRRVVAVSEFVRLETTPARFPARAIRKGQTGWVDVIFTVTSTGTTADIEIIGAEPANVFENSVINAVQQWTFEPREFRGQPIDQRAAARLVFELE